jgi:hypothetical protein
MVYLVDLNADKNPEMIVNANIAGYYYWAYINKDEEVRLYSFYDNDYMFYLDLFYDFKNDKNIWYFVKTDGTNYCLSDIDESINNEETSCPDDHFFSSKKKLEAKYYSLDAVFSYYEVKMDDIRSYLRLAMDGEGYLLNNSVEDAKDYNSELYDKYVLTCNKKSDTGGGYNYNKITFENNKITVIEDGYIAELKNELSKEKEDEYLKGLSEDNDGSIFYAEHSGKTYKFYTFIDESLYMKLIFEDKEDDLTYENVDAIIDSFKSSGYTCKIE